MPTSEKPFTSVRLSEIERKALLKVISMRADASPLAAKRGHTRYTLPAGYSVVGELEQAGGTPQRLVISVRDISRGGLSMLHGAYIHLQSRCVFRFFDANRKQVAMAYAKVVRCEHVKGPIHDVGVKFDMPFPVEQFLIESSSEGAKPVMYPALQAFVDELSGLVRSGADLTIIRGLLGEIHAAIDAAVAASPAAPAATSADSQGANAANGAHSMQPQLQTEAPATKAA